MKEVFILPRRQDTENRYVGDGTGRIQRWEMEVTFMKSTCTGVEASKRGGVERGVRVVRAVTVSPPLMAHPASPPEPPGSYSMGSVQCLFGYILLLHLAL